MNQLTKELMCIAIRNGAEIWIEKDRAETLISLLEQKKEKGFISLEGQFINIADVVGIFSADKMADLTRRKNGQWKCEAGGYWHNRGEICAHRKGFSSTN